MVFVLRRSEWFAIPEHFLWYDRLYLRCAVPFASDRPTPSSPYPMP